MVLEYKFNHVKKDIEHFITILIDRVPVGDDILMSEHVGLSFTLS
jgi:hypothetical protein